MFYLIISLVFITISLITYYILSSVSKKTDPTIKRIKTLDNKSNSNLLKKALITEQTQEKSKLNPKLEKFFLLLSKHSKQDDKNISKLTKTLMQAGYHNENSVKIFTGLKFVSGISIFLIYTIIGILGNKSFSNIFLMAIFMGLIAYFIPIIILNSKIHRRQTQIANGLSDALDLLVICIEAGLGLNAAILRVGQDIRLQSKALSEEFLLVNQDLRTGIARAKALRNMSERNKVEDLRILVGSLVLADRLGTSIADTLRAQADSLRTRVRQRAEEQAAKAGVKMLLPLVFFILPALFVVLLGPAIITILKTLSEIGAK